MLFIKVYNSFVLWDEGKQECKQDCCKKEVKVKVLWCFQEISDENTVDIIEKPVIPQLCNLIMAFDDVMFQI